MEPREVLAYVNGRWQPLDFSRILSGSGCNANSLPLSAPVGRDVEDGTRGVFRRPGVPGFSGWAGASLARERADAEPGAAAGAGPGLLGMPALPQASLWRETDPGLGLSSRLKNGSCHRLTGTSTDILDGKML